MNKPPFALILVLLFAGGAVAAIYKWVDEQGKVHYGDSPKDKQRAQKIETKPGPSEADIQDAREQSQRLIGKQLHNREPRDVLGTITISIAPAALASLPQPPIELTLLIKSLRRGVATKHRIADPNPTWMVRQKGKVAMSEQNFHLPLPPGNYKITEITAKAKNLADKSFTLVRNGPQFTVPQGNCVYIGRIVYTYTRLPRASLAQAKAAMLKLAQKKDKPVSMIYLTEGALIPVSSVINIPKKIEQAHGNEMLAKAHEMGCAEALAKP